MTAISASLVKELRDQTGAGMMDCKRALQEAGGDLEQARRLLRERGMAQAGKRAGRATTEGIVLARVRNGLGTLVAVGCETEPVAKTAEFGRFAERLLDAVEREGADAVAALDDERQELAGKLGENVVPRATRFQSQDGEVIAAYVHPPAKKIGVLVKGKGTEEAARRLAMHISFAAPRYATRADVPTEEVDAERAIYEKLPELESKPAEVRAKIIDGMLTKRFFAESVLADQPWIHDTAKTVSQALREEGLDVVEFERYALAE